MYRKLDEETKEATGAAAADEGKEPCTCQCIEPVEKGEGEAPPRETALVEFGVYWDING